MFSFGSGNRRKNTKGQRIAKLKRKITAKQKKLAQSNELAKLQKQWDQIKGR